MAYSSNYLIDSNHEQIYKYHQQKKTDAINDMEYFKNLQLDPIESEKSEEIFIFINMSFQSNGYMNFMNDDKKYIGKIINLYFHKKNSIDFIFKIFIKDSNIIRRLENIILNSDFDYHTPMKIIIDKYIDKLEIKNYFIYY